MDDHHLLVTGDQETAAQKAESVRGFSLRRSFGLDEDFVRPRPEVDRTDLLLTGVVVALCAVQLELTRSMGLTRDYGSHPWTEYPAILSAALALVWRRRFPIVVMAYTFGHFFVISHLVPTVAFNLS